MATCTGACRGSDYQQHKFFEESLLECSPAGNLGSFPGWDMFVLRCSSRGWRWPWSSLFIAIKIFVLSPSLLRIICSAWENVSGLFLLRYPVADEWLGIDFPPWVLKSSCSQSNRWTLACRIWTHPRTRRTAWTTNCLFVFHIRKHHRPLKASTG